MKVLVGYASAHGSTEKVAYEIADKLLHARLSVEVRPLESVAAFDIYDALVIGSAVHDGKWIPGAAERLLRHAATLRTRPIWLFSVSTLGQTSSAFGTRLTRALRLLRRDSTQLSSLRQAIRPLDHRHFAGAIARSHWGLAGRLFMKAMGGRYGDHRDIEDIARWGNGIARTLIAREPVGTSSSARP